MKRGVLFIYLGLICSLSYSQSSPVDKLFDKYSGQEGFTSVNISKQMFDMFSSMDSGSGEDKDFKNVTSKLTGIKILAYEGKEGKNINFYQELMKELPSKEYQELMVIKEKDQNVKFLTREHNGKIVELILISGGKDNTLICITGDIDLKTISKLSKSMQIEGMDKLDKIEKWPLSDLAQRFFPFFAGMIPLMSLSADS